jgi:hypothetical protein
MPTLATILYGKDQERWSAIPSTTLLHKITQRDYGEGTARWIAVIERDGYLPVRIALGDPKRSTECFLELPSWLLMDSPSGYGEEVMIKYEKAENYKKAQHLVFRALEDTREMLGEDLAIQDFLEQPLSELGILEEGQMIRVPVLEIPLLLEKVEPKGPLGEANPVFLDGAEVGLEILWPSSYEPAREPEKQIQTTLPLEKEKEDDFQSMLPMSYPGVKEFYYPNTYNWNSKGNTIK